MPVKRKIQAYCNHIYLQRSQKSKNKRGQLVPNISARNRKTDFYFFFQLKGQCLLPVSWDTSKILQSSVQSCDFGKIQIEVGDNEI